MVLCRDEKLAGKPEWYGEEEDDDRFSPKIFESRYLPAFIIPSPMFKAIFFPFAS